MTNDQIRTHIDTAISKAFQDYTSESGEIETGEKGDGRFFGKVAATRYSGLPCGSIFVAIGQSEKGVQIVKIGKSECANPDADSLDAALEKELGIDSSGAEA